jgi:hypothetical protein
VPHAVESAARHLIAKKQRALVCHDAPAQLLPNSKMYAFRCHTVAEFHLALGRSDNSFLRAARRLAVHIDIARQVEAEFNWRSDVRLHNYNCPWNNT